MVEAEAERYWALAEEGEALERSQARRPIEITPLGESASSSAASRELHARRHTARACWRVLLTRGIETARATKVKLPHVA